MLSFLFFHVAFEVTTLTGKSFIIVKDAVGLLGMADTPLANKAGTIASGFELAKVSVVQGFLGEIRTEGPDPVTGCVLAGEYTSPVSHADGRGHKGILEQRTLRSHLVDIGRVDDLVAHHTQSIGPLVIGHEVDDVGAVGKEGRVKSREQRATSKENLEKLNRRHVVTVDRILLKEKVEFTRVARFAEA